MKSSGTDGTISVKVYPWQFSDNATTVWGLTGPVVNIVAEKTAALSEKLNMVVAHTDVDLCIKDPATGDRMVRSSETNAGDLCADAYRAQAGNVDVAFVNGGDGNNMFQNDNVLQRSVKLDYQVVIDYITENLGGNVGAEYADPYGQGRITIVTEAQ